MTDVVDATAEEVGHEIVAVDQPSHTLFRTDNPVEAIERATQAADALKDVIVSKGLTQNIQGKEYVKVEGWTLLGSLLGVVPVCQWTRQVENGWEARVEARTLDGRVMGAAEAQCTHAERMWAKRDEYALRSMAQTRATSKALRAPLGFIVSLAGYEPTPSDEMPSQEPVRSSSPPITNTQYAAIVELIPQVANPLDKLAEHLACEPTREAVNTAIKSATADEASRTLAYLRGLVVA